MQFTYRGVQYQPQSIGQVTIPNEEVGVYRGTKVPFRQLPSPPAPTGFALLTYRGAEYRSPRYDQVTEPIVEYVNPSGMVDAPEQVPTSTK